LLFTTFLQKFYFTNNLQSVQSYNSIGSMLIFRFAGYCLIALCLGACTSRSLVSSTQTIGFRIAQSYKRKAVVPFNLYGNLIVVPVFVNRAKDTLNFAVDTGVNGILVLNPSLDTLFSPHGNSTRIPVRGLGSPEVFWAHVSSLNHLRVGSKLINEAANVMVMDDSVFNLSSYAGKPIHGLLGSALFEHLVVKIDYQRQRLTFYNRQYRRWRRQLKGYHVDTLFLHGEKPYMPLWIQQAGERKLQPLRVLLDSGAGHTLLLEIAADSSLRLPPQYIEGRIGATLSGDWYGAVGRLPRVQIARWQMENVLVGFPDTTHYVYRKPKGIEVQGAIGFGMMSRFHWVFDYRNRRVWLYPNKNAKKPFEYSFTGIDWVVLPPDFRTFMVSEVHPLSEAWKAGLRPGDILLGVNEFSASELTLNHLYKITEEEGKEIVLLVRRNNNLMLICFTAKRLI
jgi:hypothetical protein